MARDKARPRAWGYRREPSKSSRSWINGNGHPLGFDIPNDDWTILYERPVVVPDSLAFLGMSWADVPDRFGYVGADKGGAVWGYAMPPKKGKWVALWSPDGGVRGEEYGRLCHVPADSFGDWGDSLRIRPTLMKEILGVTWDDVPATHHYVAADEDGEVWSYTRKPYQIGGSHWGITEAKPLGFEGRQLTTVTLPPNLSWRNTLFTRPGYTPQ